MDVIRNVIISTCLVNAVGQQVWFKRDSMAAKETAKRLAYLALNPSWAACVWMREANSDILPVCSYFLARTFEIDLNLRVQSC